MARKRKRRAVRSAAAILALLAAGPITAAAIVFSLELWVHSPREDNPRGPYVDDRTDSSPVLWNEWIDDIGVNMVALWRPGSGDEGDATDPGRGAGDLPRRQPRQQYVDLLNSFNDDGDLYVWEIGYPLRMSYLAMSDAPSGLVVGKVVVSSSPWLPSEIPTGVLPTGLVVNSVLYAGAWYVVWWTATTTKRTAPSRWRRRRGRCEKCGYALDALRRCPECGALRHVPAIDLAAETER